MRRVKPEQVQSYIKGNVLSPDETIVWQGRGRPPEGLAWRWYLANPKHIQLGWILFIAAAAGFASGVSVELTLPPFLIGAWLAGAGQRQFKRLQRTFYVITDQRAILLDIGHRIKEHTRDIKKLSHVEADASDLALAFDNESPLVFEHCTDLAGAKAQAEKHIR